MRHRDSDAQKNPPGLAGPRGANRNPDARQILSPWAARGQTPAPPSASQQPLARSIDPSSVPMTDKLGPARCLTKRGLADYLGISVRSLDRAAALGLLPAPDLHIGIWTLA